MLSHRTLLITIVAGALAVMAPVGNLIWSGYREALSAAEVRTNDYAAILEAQLEATLRRADAELQQLQLTVPVAALQQDAVSGNAQVNEALKAPLIKFPELYGIGVFDAGGAWLYASTTTVTQPTNISDRGYFRSLRDNPQAGLVFSEVIVARTTGRPSVALARALRDEHGVFRGVVVALLELEQIRKLFQALNVGADGVISIYRNDNFTLVLRWPQIQGQLNLALPPEHPARTALAGPDRTATFTLAAPIDGRVRVYSQHALSAYPFYIAVGIARDEALAAWRARSLVVGLSTLLLVGLLLALLQLLWRADAARAGLAAIVEHANDAIYSRALDGTVLTWNSGTEKMLGYTAAEAIGKPVTFTLPPGEAPIFTHSNDNVLRGEVVVRESKRITKDGRVIDVWISASPVRGNAGSIVGVSILMQDITALKQAQSALKQSEARFRATFEQAAVGIAHFDLQHRNIMVNQRYSEIVGYTPQELLGKAPGFLNLPDDPGMGSEQREQLLSGAINHYAHEKAYRRKDGAVIWVTRTESLARDEASAPLYYIRVIEDITARKEVAERYRATFENAPVGIMHTDLGSDRILHVNHKLCELLGYTQEELLGLTTTDILHPDHEGTDRGNYRERMLRGEIDAFSSERLLLRKDRSTVWVNRTVSLVRDAAGKPLYFIRIVEDITGRKQTEERLSFMAQYDALTGLPNRYLLLDRLDAAMQRAKRNHTLLGVMVLDIDRFKQINDTRGHAIGDLLLQQVAERLAGTLRATDTIARLGGDEFTVLAEGVADINEITAVADKIITSFTLPFEIESSEVFTTTSVGITIYPLNDQSRDELLKNADVAMYHAKQERNAWQLYRPDMNLNAASRMGMEVELRHALERDEFELHYQPLLNVRNRELVGLEALIRWNSKTLGRVAPADFIPLAEDTGLIVPIGEWILRAACKQCKTWGQAGIAPIPVWVNISAPQFRHSNLLQLIKTVLVESDLDANWLGLEITESNIMQHAEQTVKTLADLRAIGVAIAIDDFGTGYSSLSYLKRFPVNKIKVDQSFVRDISSDANDAAIVSAVIAMSKQLGIKTIAEGVETAEQLEFLARLECDEYQGYFFSRPIPAAEVAPLILSHRLQLARGG